MSVGVCVCVCLINVMRKMQLLSMKGFVDRGRTVQSDMYIGHNVIIANFGLRCSQHWETLPLIWWDTCTHGNLTFVIRHTQADGTINLNGTGVSLVGVVHCSF